LIYSALTTLLLPEAAVVVVEKPVAGAVAVIVNLLTKNLF
jgi:hypothetical protein